MEKHLHQECSHEHHHEHHHTCSCEHSHEHKEIQVHKKMEKLYSGHRTSFYYQLYIGPGNGSGLPGYGTRG